MHDYPLSLVNALERTTIQHTSQPHTGTRSENARLPARSHMNEVTPRSHYSASVLVTHETVHSHLLLSWNRRAYAGGGLRVIELSFATPLFAQRKFQRLNELLLFTVARQVDPSFC